MIFTCTEKELILEMLNKNAFPGSMARDVGALIDKVENSLSALPAETELDFDKETGLPDTE